MANSIENKQLETRLNEDEEKARLRTLSIEQDSSRNGILILVCAQHPLTSSGKPNIIFKARLDEAILRYKLLKQSNEKVTIRVPGTIHNTDKISLAEAGKKYLLKNHIPENDISADSTEENGTDEISYAYKIFEENQLKQLHICCSENQVFRNKIACIELFNILPYFHTITTLDTPLSHQLGFEIINPKGGLRFFNKDRGASIDAEARKIHLAPSVPATQQKP